MHQEAATILDIQCVIHSLNYSLPHLDTQIATLKQISNQSISHSENHSATQSQPPTHAYNFTLRHSAMQYTPPYLASKSRKHPEARLHYHHSLIQSVTVKSAYIVNLTFIDLGS